MNLFLSKNKILNIAKNNLKEENIIKNYNNKTVSCLGYNFHKKMVD